MTKPIGRAGAKARVRPAGGARRIDRVVANILIVGFDNTKSVEGTRQKPGTTNETKKHRC